MTVDPGIVEAAPTRAQSEPRTDAPVTLVDETAPAPPIEVAQRLDLVERPIVPDAGNGEFRVDSVSVQDHAGTHYSVEVERGLPFASNEVAEEVAAILGDARSWVGLTGETFSQVDHDPQLRILVATPATTDALCAPLETLGSVSCRNGDLVVLNARRWAFGIPDYRGHLGGYRRYLVNHEVGHSLGQEHVGCPGLNEPAPVMVQQTYGLGDCRRNAWPTIA